MSKLNSYILLDRSGSMSNNWDETINAVNTYVDELKGKSKNTVTLATFDSVDKLVFDVVRDKVTAEDWDPVTTKEISPRGLTPLFDAVSRIVTMAEEADKKKTVLIVVTDGHENTSREVTKDAAKACLDRFKDKGWEVIFLGADFDAFGEARNVGISMTHTLNMTKGNYTDTLRTAASKSMMYASMATPMDFTDEERNEASGKGK